MHIGIAGTGKMGSAVAKRLLGLGHEVTVWNRRPERAQPLLALGAAIASSPHDLAARCDTVISLLTDQQALARVYGGDDGLLAGVGADRVFIDMSTVMPAQALALAERVAAAGASYLECPVGGSVGPAAEGKLLGFVGGEAATLARVRPLLELLCRRIEHVGAVGAGSCMKLAVNLPLMVYWQTLGEALSLLEPLGLDPARTIDIFADSSGGPNMLKVRGAMISQALAGTAGPQVTVNVATLRKDMQAMLAQAALGQRQLPLTALALQSFERAAAAGLDAADCSQLPVWWLREGGKAG